MILDKLNEAVGEGRVRKDESLVEHSLFGEAKAEYYFETGKADELVRVVKRAREQGVPVFVFGTGSRLSFKEKIISGLVIKNLCRHFSKLSVRGKIVDKKIGVKEVFVLAESGVIANQLVRFSLDEGLNGLEEQLGINGTVGGAFFTDGWFRQKEGNVNESLQSLRILNEDGEIRVYKEKPDFIFQKDSWLENKEVILSVVLKLLPGNKKSLWDKAQEAYVLRSGNKKH